MGRGSLSIVIGTTFPWYLHIGTLVASQSVKQCLTVDLFLHILAYVVVIQKEHLLLYTPVLNKTRRLSPARMFVRLYRLLLIHCIYMYQWQNQHALPLVPGWIMVPSDPGRWQEKLLSSVVYGITIKYMCSSTYMSNLILVQCVLANLAEVLDLSYLMEILSGVDSDHGTGPRKNGSDNTRSTLCPIERMSCGPTTLL